MHTHPHLATAYASARAAELRATARRAAAVETPTRAGRRLSFRRVGSLRAAASATQA